MVRMLQGSSVSVPVLLLLQTRCCGRCDWLPLCRLSAVPQALQAVLSAASGLTIKEPSSCWTLTFVSHCFAVLPMQQAAAASPRMSSRFDHTQAAFSTGLLSLGVEGAHHVRLSTNMLHRALGTLGCTGTAWQAASGGIVMWCVWRSASCSSLCPGTQWLQPVWA